VARRADPGLALGRELESPEGGRGSFARRRHVPRTARPVSGVVHTRAVAVRVGRRRVIFERTQEARLKARIGGTLPRTTWAVGADIWREFSAESGSRSGLIEPQHRLDVEYQKAEATGRNLDESKQEAFIAAYENHSNRLGPEEAALFVGAGRSIDAGRPSAAGQPNRIFC
jgi:hypothetical protein